MEDSNNNNSIQDLNSVKPATGIANKPNGLKNRIIQRPPPLILDKVSNFHETNDIPSSFINSIDHDQHLPIPIDQLETTNQDANTNELMRPLPIIETPNLPPPHQPSVIEPQEDTLNSQPQQIVAIDNEALPNGWERVIDQTHGTYYIDHNAQRTQYERPYEIELTKGSMGFGFTLVESDSGLLLVRSVIPGGPAYSCGIIRPGDILVSAVGVSVSGLAHTDVARLFSTFAVGDRVRLTFARSQYMVDANLVPDEYLFSNGTNGDLAVALNSDIYGAHPHPQTIDNSIGVPTTSQYVSTQSPSIAVHQDFDFINVVLKRGDKGFGFTIGDSVAGQKVRVIQNNEVCSNLKQGDILININGQDMTKMTHQQVVETLKQCPAGEDVSLVVKRKRRFRSKTPAAMRSESNGEFSQHNTPQRNCKTPNVDSLMLQRSGQQNTISRTLFAPPEVPNAFMPSIAQQLPPIPYPSVSSSQLPVADYVMMHQQPVAVTHPQSIYGVYQQQQQQQPVVASQEQNIYAGYEANEASGLPQPTNFIQPPRPSSTTNSEGFARDNGSNSVNPSEVSLPPVKFTNANGLHNMNEYNNFMNNDKLMMMRMQQQQASQYQPILPPSNPPASLPLQTVSNSDYHPMPLYSNCELIKSEQYQYPLQVPPKPPHSQQFLATINQANNVENFYANNEEIAMQRQQMQYESLPPMGSTNQPHHQYQPYAPHIIYQPHPHLESNGFMNGYHNQYNDLQQAKVPTNEETPDDYEYHQVDLDRENTDSNWGIRLIGGAEVERAISIGSIVFGGAASKNGRLKSGDEIISINNINVVGETHQHVVELISACSNRASLVVRRKKFAEACEVVLSKNVDEGFGFVIISSGNCALIGRIIEGSPADRCQQLHVRDRIIAVNGRYITPNIEHPEIVDMIKGCGSTLRLRIIPVDCYTVELIKCAQSDSFGFSVRGGADNHGTPFYILRVAPDGPARDLLNVGDQIIEINGIPTAGMTHQQAATIIKYSDPIVKLKLRRNYVTPPSLLVDSPQALRKFDQVTAEMKTVNPMPKPTSFHNQNDTPALIGVESISDLNGSFVGGSIINSQQGGEVGHLGVQSQTQSQSNLIFNDQWQHFQHPMQMDTTSNQVHSQTSLPLYAT